VVACLPAGIALTALIWPPATHGERAFSMMVWLGLAALLVLVPSTAGVSGQLVRRGSQTLVPSAEAAYPWILALIGTSLFAGFGIARRLLGETAMRRRRLVRGILVASGMAVGSAAAFSAVALGNEIGLRDRPVVSSRFGPTDVEREPPLCDANLAIGTTAQLELHLRANLDGRPLGTVDLSGQRAGVDFRWLAYAATVRELGLRGAARIGPDAWTRDPVAGWQRATSAEVADGSVDQQAYAAALSPGSRAAAELHGIDVIEGARARHCRVAIDGPTFRLAFPQVAWLVGEADLARWRGQLDYWIFLDGQLGRIIGSVNGDAGGIKTGALQATVEVELNATERGDDIHMAAPAL
jgi:hypothetical protein